MIVNFRAKKINRGRFIITLRLGIIRFVFQLALVQDTLGIASGEPFKSPQVLFWDFINTPKYLIERSLRHIQFKFNLGNIYLFQSGNRNSFRAICIDLIPLEQAQTIIMQTNYVDKEFVKYFLTYGYKTIRVIEKSRDKEPNYFVRVLNSTTEYRYVKYIKSNCHALHLLKLGVIMQQEYDYLDNHGYLDNSKPQDLIIELYETQYRGK